MNVSLLDDIKYRVGVSIVDISEGTAIPIMDIASMMNDLDDANAEDIKKVFIFLSDMFTNREQFIGG